MDDAARTVRYLCFVCGSQGVKMCDESGALAVTCPRCGNLVTTEFEIGTTGLSDQV